MARVFTGSALGLKYAFRDLDALQLAVAHTPGRTAVVQAGGNLGVWAAKLAQDFEAVYCFEPEPLNFRMLSANVPEPNVVLIQAALGSDHGLIGMARTRRDGKPTLHEGIAHVAGPGIVPTMRIDDIGLKVCDLIYLDLEGYELHALRGAQKTIRACRPTLGVEINKSAAYFGIDKEDVRGLVISMGYVFVARTHSDDLFVPKERAEK